MIKRYSAEWFISHVFFISKIFHTGEFIPWQQDALCWRINLARKTFGEIEGKEFRPWDNLELGRHLSRLKSQGKVERLYWRTPSQGNIWIWKSDK